MADVGSFAGTPRVLGRAHVRGQAEHPGLALPAERYEAHVLGAARRRLARREEAATEVALAAAVETAHAGDLYLAAAAACGVPGAWERVQALHGAGLVALARSRGASGAAAEQAVAELWSYLAVASSGPEGAPPIAQYDGSGRLFSWLATCLLRRLAAEAGSGRARSTLAGDVPAPGRGAGEDPASAAERRELEETLGRVVRDAVEDLTVQERAALVLSHRDGWSGKEVARVLGVGEPRVSRLRTRATEKLRGVLLPVLKARGAGGGRSAVGGSWTALREAVSAALAQVAIPSGPPAPSGEDSPVRRSPDG